MTETKLVSFGGELPNVIWHYIQYFNGVKVAHFKIRQKL